MPAPGYSSSAAPPDLELFRVAMQSAGVGFCLVSPEGQFLEVNPALCQFLGRDAETLRQATWQDLTHPDDLATDVDLVEEVKANRRQTYRLRKRFLRPDGTVLWGDLNVGCVRHANGGVRLFVSQIVDISAAVAAEQALAQREQQLQELAERLKLATEIMGLGIYDADLRCGTATYSDQFLRNLGYEPGEWQPTPEEWQRRVHPDDRDRLAASNATLAAGGTTTVEFRLLHRDGSYRWFLGHGKGSDCDAQGQAQRVMATGFDITERKLTEQGLTDAQAQLHATLDALLEPHILLAPIRDGDGRIVDFCYHDANPAACAYNRLPRDQLLGMTVLELMPAHQGTGLLAHYAEAMESGNPLVLDDYAYPTDFLGEERRYDIRAVRVGELLSYSWRDVTERHRSAERLEVSERRFRLLAENATDVVLHMREGGMVWVSPSVTTVLGWRPEEWLGRLCSDFHEPADHATYTANLRLLAQGQSVAARNRIRARDGSWHWMDTRVSIFLDERGQPDGILAAGRLVDAEVAAEQALERKSAELASKLRTSLTAAVVAHEINQPLSAILLQAQLALGSAATIGAAAEPLQGQLVTLIAEGERVVTTIERMRMLLRNVETPREPLDLAVVIQNALLYMQPLANREGVRLGLEAPPGELPIAGDAVQLQRAIANLIRNSLEALVEFRAGGDRRIQLTVTRQAEGVELRVSDNGPGFGALQLADLPLITTKHEGMGLGLYVVQTTIANHGGTLAIGRSPLGGAEVILRLPQLRL